MDHAAFEADGWTRLPTHKFSAAIGPTWLRLGEGGPTIALFADEAITNENIGVVHGGALLTFTDIAFGAAISHLLQGVNCVTAQIQYQFASAVKVGALITCQPEIVRSTSSMVFVRGLIMADDRIAGSGDGIFKLLDPDKLASLQSRAGA